MSNSGVHTESPTEPFILTTGVDCSNSVNHDQVQMLSYSKYSLLVLSVAKDEINSLNIQKFMQILQILNLQKQYFHLFPSKPWAENDTITHYISIIYTSQYIQNTY